MYMYSFTTEPDVFFFLNLQCEENYGMFVRLTQLMILDDDGNPVEMTATTPEDVKGSRSRLSRYTTVMFNLIFNKVCSRTLMYR